MSDAAVGRLDFSGEGPLAATLTLVNRATQQVNVTVGRPPAGEWLTHHEISRPGSVSLAELLARCHRSRPHHHRHMVAMRLVGAFSFQVVAGSVGAYLSARRVPDISPANVFFHVNSDTMGDAIALGAGRFCALPGDAASLHPDARVAADLSRLREGLRAQLELLMIHIIEAISAATGIGKRALWASVADAIVLANIYGARLLNRRSDLEADVRGLVMVPGSALKGRTGLCWIEHDGRREAFLERGSCCLLYRIAGTRYCTTCPLQPPAIRAARLRDSMATNPEQRAEPSSSLDPAAPHGSVRHAFEALRGD
jgi:hypothetical protein